MARILKPAKDVVCGATISECGQYRYQLRRDWIVDGYKSPNTLMVIGLNPSTADAHDDDPTIAKLTRLARKWGHTSLVMVNLFAWRSTDPKAMMKVDAPVGPDNDMFLRTTAMHAHTILCAWGKDGKHLRRGHKVSEMLQHIAPLHALKLTNEGQPYHPLYLPETLTPFVWKSAALNASSGEVSTNG